MPTTFRKKPVEIQAVQWTGDNLYALMLFTEGQFERVNSVTYFTARVHDDLHNTWIDLKTGDWVIRGVKGEFYPIEESVLTETYERDIEHAVPADAGDLDPERVDVALRLVIESLDYDLHKSLLAGESEDDEDAETYPGNVDYFIDAYHGRLDDRGDDD